MAGVTARVELPFGPERSKVELSSLGKSDLRYNLFLWPLAAMQVFRHRAATALQSALRRQRYSTATSAYAATAENLRIDNNTKVIYQGFTGKQGRSVNPFTT